jgi:hypothetical protein
MMTLVPDGYVRPFVWTYDYTVRARLVDAAGEIVAEIWPSVLNVYPVAGDACVSYQEHASTSDALLDIRDTFPGAPPCPPETIREVMAARGEERWQEPLVWRRHGDSVWLHASEYAQGQDYDNRAAVLRGSGSAQWWSPTDKCCSDSGTRHEGPGAPERCIADLRWIGYNVPEVKP